VNDDDIYSGVDAKECGNVKEELKEKRDDSMTETNKRVVHEAFGAGEIVGMGYFGRLSVASVRFDDHSFDGKLVLLEELKPEINKNGEVKVERQDGDKGKGKIDDKVSDTERKLAHEKEMERIQAEGIALAKEIGDMSNETLIDGFGSLIRNGAGPGYRGVIFMKREILRRMDRGDHL
jgi:hypothetical protein